MYLNVFSDVLKSIVHERVNEKNNLWKDKGKKVNVTTQ